MLPEPPYYAVIFTSQLGPTPEGYKDTSARMMELAHQQPGFLSVEATRNEAGLGITVSYWRTLDDVAQWRKHMEHAQAQQNGRSRWYTSYDLRVAKVERHVKFERPSAE